MTGFEYVELTRQWIGTPFHPTSAQRGVGCDCVGLLIGTAREAGFDVSSVPSWGTWMGEADIREALLRVAVPVLCSQAGDLLWFRIRHDPLHFGIWSGRDSFLHAYQSIGRVTETPWQDFWKTRLVQVFRWRGVED